MNVIGVIPARIGSTRFPEKPLALIAGKPLLQWVIEGSLQSKKINEIIVATDDSRIANLANKCGVKAIMTDANLATGTDRIYAAIKNIDCDLVINIQGDEPLIKGHILDSLVDRMILSPSAEMGTLAHAFKDQKDLQNPNMVKVLVNKNSEAIYFSRFPIPFSRQDINTSLSLFHIGIYAFKKSFLKTFCETQATPLELAESLEQLRALHLGAKIHVVQVDYETHGVDTAEDIKRVETIIKRLKS